MKKQKFLKRLDQIVSKKKKTQQMFLIPRECIINMVNLFDAFKTKRNHSNIINIVQL